MNAARATFLGSKGDRLSARRVKTYSMPDDATCPGCSIRDETSLKLTWAAHRHDFLQMHLQLAGEARYTIGARTRDLRPGSIGFVLPYRIHRTIRQAQSRCYIINFHHRFLRPDITVDPMCVDTVPFERAPELALFTFQDFIEYRLEGADLEIAREACQQMMQQSSKRRLFSVELVRANLLSLLGLVCQRHESDLSRLMSAVGHDSPRRDALMRITCYIKAHLSEHISLAEVAAAIAVSPNQVTRVLKRETGKTFMQFLTEQRLQKAQELLANTSMRVAQVGEAAGFEDNAYFARRFRQYFNVSPRAYRGASPLQVHVV